MQYFVSSFSAIFLGKALGVSPTSQRVYFTSATMMRMCSREPVHSNTSHVQRQIPFRIDLNSNNLSMAQTISLQIYDSVSLFCGANKPLVGLEYETSATCSWSLHVHWICHPTRTRPFPITFNHACCTVSKSKIAEIFTEHIFNGLTHMNVDKVPDQVLVIVIKLSST